MQSATRELTGRALVLGLLLSVIMGAANVYLGLKAGMTVSASIPAAVVAMLILRGICKNGSILEANQVQTAASAGESLAAGIIFTMPALLLIGAWQKFEFVTTTLVAFAGGLLGILFMIPMRRVFVVRDNPELTYPEGVACASVLKAGESSRDDALAVAKGTAIGGVFKLLAGFAGVLENTLEGATALLGRVFYFGADMSPALVAVGLIVRLNVALLIFVGGALGWLICIPLLGGGTGDPLDAAWTLWSGKVRYIGVGAMVVGGIASIVRVRHGLVEAVRELRKATRVGVASELDRDIPPRAILGLTVVCVALIAAVYYSLTDNLAITAATTLIMIVMAFFFTAVASYIVGLVGNSNSPVSGMTITAVLFTGGLLLLLGFSGTQGMVATLGVAAVVCCAACTSGDICNDLKTGQLVGASPYRQQIMQILGVAVASLVMAPILQLLHDNTPGGIGGRHLAAPQASLFKSLAEGFFGGAQLPWGMVALGAGLGCVILAIDRSLQRAGVEFRAHLMPIAVGMYLPFGLSVPIVIGGLMSHLFERRGARDDGAGRSVLFASGVIAGESLMGVGIAVLASAGVAQLSPALGDAAKASITAVAFALVLAAFWVLAQRRPAR
jgi:putative OPT family oligopeptide transporter